ncbi:MAG: malonate transporter subunit MadL [Clostridia bacterium]|nr:malonate transporter subunit MadL [Clostridia bacterium]MDD4048986.1 malonate transporter subunit MadL [Clostridia bacterium]
MAIYGLTLLSVCMLLGTLLGDILGKAVNVSANVGGVGFAMLFLILISDYLLENNMLSPKAQDGIKFWSMMYIPVVVAMTARQNVVAAVKGGPMAILAGVLAVAVAFAFVPMISKIGAPGTPLPENDKEKEA